ncbi:MAG: PorT family protein [Candidatus Cloacimonetes bacterium]|nr:PorT family protein [Candidatus Cloacimonadota bacterium]
MKKIALLILVCVIGVSLSAYESGFVVFGGATMSWASDDFSDADSKIGFHGGVSMEHFGVIENAIFETGIRFNMKGFTFSESESEYGYSYSFEEDVSINYIDFFAKAKLDIGDLPIYPYFGAYAAFMLSANSSGYFRDNYSNDSWDEDIKDELNTLDFGLLLGADLVFQDKFYIGVGFDLGLSKFFEDKYGGETWSAKTRAVLFSVGYIF